TYQGVSRQSGNRYQLLFVSSRRRHTKSKRDWSSDVCSSDLHLAIFDSHIETMDSNGSRNKPPVEQDIKSEGDFGEECDCSGCLEIGRASSREREERWGLGG